MTGSLDSLRSLWRRPSRWLCRGVAGAALLQSAAAADVPFPAEWAGGSGDWISLNWNPQPLDFILEAGVPIPIPRWPDNATNSGDYVYLVEVDGGHVSLGSNVTVSTLSTGSSALVQIRSGGVLNLEGYAGFEGAAVDNDGVIFLTGDGRLEAGSAFVSGGLSLTGDGAVQLAGADTLLKAAIIHIGGSQLVHGYGGLGTTAATGLIQNDGDIIANVSGEKLTIRGGLLRNDDLVRATGGGQVEFRTTSIENDDLLEAEAGSLLDFNDLDLENDGIVHAKTGGLVQLKDLEIEGSGILQASGAGALQFRGVELDGGTISVATTATAQSTEGTLTWRGNGALQGVLQTAGGGLVLRNLSLNNAAGTVLITPGNAATFGDGLVLQGGTVDGGGIASVSGTVRLSGTANAVTIGALTLQVADGARLVFDGTTQNNGSIQLLDSGALPGVRVSMDATPTLGGTGELVFASGTLGEIVTTNGTTFHNGAGHTIRTAPGTEGYVRTAFSNAGSLFGHGTGGRLYLETDSATNTGLLGATAGGRLDLSNVNNLVLENVGGTLHTGDAASLIVSANTTTIRGGAISGPGSLYNAGTLIFDGTTSPVTITDTRVQLPASVLRLRGAVANSGTIFIEDPSPFIGAGTVQVDGAVALSGTGAIVFHTIYGNVLAPLVDATPDLLTNGPDHRITSTPGAAGTLQVPLLNHGLIDATGTGTILTMDGPSVTSDGRLGASLGGQLGINNISINNADGEIFSASGGNVQFNTVTLTGGGTLTGDGTHFANALTIDNTAGSTTIASGATLAAVPGSITLRGALVNDGTILVADNSPFAPGAALVVEGAAALHGSGRLRFGSIFSNNIINGTTGAASQLTLGSAQTLTTTPGHLGTISVAQLVNTGVVEGRGHDGTTPGRITLNGTLVTNTGTLRAIEGGLLWLEMFGTVENAGGTIRADGAGSYVNLTGNTVVRGGTFASADGGYIFLSGNPTLDGIASPITSTARQIMNATLTLRGTIVNDGVIEISGGISTALRSGDNATLAGSGRLQFNTNANNNVNPASVNPSGLTIGAQQTVTTLPGAQGIFTGALVNQGTMEGRGITSGGVRGQLLLNGTQVTNNGTLRAMESGQLTLEMNGTVENAGGTISADGTDSFVHLTGATVVRGGTLASSNGGYIFIQGNNTLDGIASPITSTARQVMGATLTLRGTVVNDGIIEVSGGISTALRSGDNATLAGSGRLQFNTNANNNVNPAGVSPSGLTIGAQQTVTTLPGAQGIFSGALVNHGTMEGRGLTSGSIHGRLLFNGSQFTNTGTVRATEGGRIDFELSGPVENAGATLLADGPASLFVLASTTIRGGLLTGDGYFFAQGFNTLDGTASPVRLGLGTRYLIPAHTTLALPGGLTNDGSIQLIDLPGPGSAFLRLDATQTIGGSGELLFPVLGGNVVYTNNSAFVLTNGPDHTIRTSSGGVGLVQARLVNEGTVRSDGDLTLEGPALRNAPTGLFTGNGIVRLEGAALANDGTIAPGNSAGDLLITGNVISSSTAVFRLELGGTVVGTQFDQLQVSGTLTLDGQLAVSLLGGFLPAPTDSFTVITGGSITGAFDNMTANRVSYDFGSFEVLQTPASVILRDFQAVPEPSTTLLLLAVGGGWFPLRRRAGRLLPPPPSHH